MTPEEIVKVFNDHPEMLDAPEAKRMFDESLPFVEFNKLPEQTRKDFIIHDEYLKLKRDLQLKRGFDDHYDRPSWTKEEHDKYLKWFDDRLVEKIKGLEEHNAESLDRTHAKQDWEKLKNWDLANKDNYLDFQLAPHIPKCYI